MNNFLRVRNLICISLICVLSGCSSNQYSSGNSSQQQAAQQQAERFNHLATKTKGNEAISFKLQSIEQLILADDLEQAERQMKYEVPGKLEANNSTYKQILLAQLAMAKQNLELAKQELRSVWTPNKLPQDLQVKFFSTRAELYRRNGNLVESVQERINLNKQLTSEAARQANNSQIWDTLNQLPINDLNNLRNANSNELNGWVSFASITKQYDSSPEQLISALDLWKQKYPNHPAIAQLSPELQATSSTDRKSFSHNLNVKRPKKIALLLPLQGTHAKSAQAIRDGFLAAFYVHKDDPNKPAIQVYDTTQQSSLQGLYRQVVDDGADFIVGPLIKEEVEELNQGIRPQVPILALNSIKGRGQENIFQFSLSPEMEAQAVAKKAWQDGHRNALIIIPKSAWGERMRSAFQDYWTGMGGRLVGTAEIESQSNLTKEIQRLLAIDASEQRATQLKQLGIKCSFEPRRRQDLDMVFIATNAPLARQVKPLLNFYYASNVAAYASSSIYSGKSQPSLDQDLNGIQFCDMPWLLDNSIESRNAYKAVASLWPQDFDQYARLYALGLDAYKIALQMEQMNLLPELGISGMTGMLTIDNQQQVQRKLTWASFRRGVPRVTGSSYE